MYPTNPSEKNVPMRANGDPNRPGSRYGVAQDGASQPNDTNSDKVEKRFEPNVFATDEDDDEKKQNMPGKKGE